MAMKYDLVVAGSTLFVAGKRYRCVVGKAGVVDAKKEADGGTPFGVFALRKVLYRADKTTKPKTCLPVEQITQDAIWCDDVLSAEYNKQLKLPFVGSYENLWRDDDVYDIVVPLGYNDELPEPGKGSAIFIHVSRENYTPTDGCVALQKEDLLEVLSYCSEDTHIFIKKQSK